MEVMPSVNLISSSSMDTPKKTNNVPTKGKARNRPVTLNSGSKHITNPTEQSVGYGGGKKGTHALDGAQGSKGKYC